MESRIILVAGLLSGVLVATAAPAAQPLPAAPTPPKPVTQALPATKQELPAPALKPPAKTVTADYAAMYENERRENEQLRQEVQALRKRLLETIHPGGSLVRAYCESEAVSRNTAGARSDCAATGYSCEPVSGLCRTSCQGSGMCAVGYICDSYNSQCVKP